MAMPASGISGGCPALPDSGRRLWYRDEHTAFGSPAARAPSRRPSARSPSDPGRRARPSPALAGARGAEAALGGRGAARVGGRWVSAEKVNEAGGRGQCLARPARAMDAQRASAAKPPSGKKMKARAPPPPGNPALLNTLDKQRPLGSSDLSLQSNLAPVRDGPLTLTVVLPSGLEKQSVVSSSQAMMDLLVELCLQNHLNPSHHALEARSAETQQALSFKPNTLLGTLNIHTVHLKEKVAEEKVTAVPPKVPEKSMRLVVNYLRTQKAVVRVSPEVPLQNILPIICAKCNVSPDHVVLLRDNINGEELELSKSLNELGLKELYAWDNRGGTFRKSSLGNEETDKEKKILGFFKANRRSSHKAEQLGPSGAQSDEDASQPATGQGLNGCLTTPNSPSMSSRSMTLGPSLSLGNVSGVSLRSEKKRRAPPPPSARPPAQDKVSEKVSLGSQIDLQKKKRRAPAPPPPQPPSPVVPTRTQDMEEKRKSAVGIGRQVPQKPPRGSARGLPQLVLPPPPPYPPPDTDAVEPLGVPGEGTGSEASDLRSTLSLSLGPGRQGGVDGAEETVSVGSCFASEDTTEDSGVLSSPSDVISLDSQHDSLKSKDKWATDQEDSSDQDVAGTPELGPPSSPLWGRNSPGGMDRRTGRADTATGNGNFFLTTQFQRTLPEFKGDLEEMEESYGTDSSSLTSSSNSVSPHYVREMLVSNGDVDTIPVTFIGEVPDDPVDLGVLCNTNNNAGSFGTEPLGRMDSGAGSAVSATLAWHQRGRTLGGSSGPRSGLTTYKIVPSKSETRQYDRAGSLSTGAILINELGDLVNPHTNMSRTFPSVPTTLDTDPQPMERIREFWRTSSAEKPLDPATRPLTTLASAWPAQQQPDHQPRAMPMPTAVPAPRPHSTTQEAGVTLEEGQGRLLSTVTCHTKEPAAGGTEVTFLRPQRRTSSQYVANAITRRIGPPKAPIPSGKLHSLSQKGREGQTSSGSRSVLLNGSACALGSTPEREGAPGPLPSGASETDGVTPLSIFGPKKKFRPVVQRPAPEDTSLHSALMEAIHSAGGTQKLRKTAELGLERGPKKPSYTEAESERSALLAAIRGHSGTHSLRKVSSSAAEELQGFRDAARSTPGPEAPPPPPVLLAPAPPGSGAPSRPHTGTSDSPVDARQALMAAIRSGTGAARLKKVPLLV
ncbi:protein cordon-bleu [Ochotona curzoniae]|uniref:protein cordon-bleu n=1 Tax=Ochotona curzoniae TaxID=130825 RepID=UPI001B3497EB|nr:protein cordon-bleu [Ochotona curzoniae]